MTAITGNQVQVCASYGGKKCRKKIVISLLKSSLYTVLCCDIMVKPNTKVKTFKWLRLHTVALVQEEQARGLRPLLAKDTLSQFHSTPYHGLTVCR